MADITMPQLGETVTEGTITKWLKQVGDRVAEDDVLFEVSTDKVDSEVPSPVAGTLTEILVQEGDTVPVGTKLAVIGDGGAAPAGDSGSEAAATEAPQAESAPAPATSESVPDAPLGDASGGPQAPAPQQEVSAPAAPPRPAAQPPAPAPTRPADQRPPSGPGDGGAKLLSPVVRRLIAENSIDPSTLNGSGPGGRITRDDVLAEIDRRRNGQPAAPAPSRPSAPTTAGGAAAAAPAAPVPSPASAMPAPAAGERDTVVPFTNIRRRTAEHMVRSKATSAHTMVAMEVDFYGVEKVRAAQKGKFKAQEGFSLTYLPFIARAVVDALADWPYLNSSVGNDELIVHNDINLGIAVDLDFEGLLVPVIHNADGKRLVAVAREVAGLAAKARGRKLTMDDISGGTFTLTNAGGLGTFLTVPVINQPQVAILSTDGVRKRPVVVEHPDGTDSIAIHPVGHLVLSWDHRAVDGAYAAAFMANVKEIIETRDWSVEL